VVRCELERLLVIVTLQGVPIVVFAKQRLERVGKQNEVRDVRRVVALYRNAPFRIICWNPNRTTPFRDNTSLRWVLGFTRRLAPGFYTFDSPTTHLKLFICKFRNRFVMSFIQPVLKRFND